MDNRLYVWIAVGIAAGAVLALVLPGLDLGFGIAIGTAIGIACGVRPRPRPPTGRARGSSREGNRTTPHTDRQNVSSGSPYEPSIGFSRAVRVGNQVVVSGTAPVWPDGHVDPGPAAQAERCWEIALAALAEAGGEPRHVVRTRQFITDRAHQQAAATVHGRLFGDVRPASTMVVVPGLLDARWLLEVELDAVIT